MRATLRNALIPLTATVLLAGCASARWERASREAEVIGGVHSLELRPDDLRKGPIRLAPNGAFEYPGFSRSARQWWAAFPYQRYMIDPDLPRLCTGHFQGEAAAEVTALFDDLNRSPPRLPPLDRVVMISHNTGYDVRMDYFGGSASYGQVYPHVPDGGSFDVTNDWQQLARRTLDIFARAGMQVEDWAPDTARIRDLRCC